jgi:hypothetical protein
LKLPGWNPDPNFEVETGQRFLTSPFSKSDTVCEATSTLNKVARQLPGVGSLPPSVPSVFSVVKSRLLF